jgi:hypothetical protein
MKLPLRCKCGTVQGELDAGQPTARAVCYCKDCQAYARFLGREGEVLDEHGGTEIIAARPRSLRFTAGQDRIACMSLSEKGPLRWYASCCRTPIGNTARSRKIAYLGLPRSCLAAPDASVNEALGPLKIALNTESARGKVRPTPLATFLGVLTIMRNVLGARVNGKYRDNPFFERGSGAPIAAPTNLTREERAALGANA